MFRRNGLWKENGLRDREDPGPRQVLQKHHQARGRRRGARVHEGRRDPAFRSHRRSDVRKAADGRRGRRRPFDVQQERLLRTGRPPRLAAVHDHRDLRGRRQELPLRREPRPHPPVSPHGRGHRLRRGRAVPRHADAGHQGHPRDESPAQGQSCVHVPPRPDAAGPCRSHARGGTGGGEGRASAGTSADSGPWPTAS